MRRFLNKPIWIITLILLIDQISKYLVKTTMFIGQEIPFWGQWGRLHFIENNGMAFGMEFAGETGKIILTLFRLAAVIGLIIYLRHIAHKSKTPDTLYIVFLSIICAGALGNIIDSMFYGVLFSESTPYEIAAFLPEAGGYAGLMHGKVVDMFYFPFIRGFWPEWIPFVGGKYIEFFRPIFNVADSMITIGVLGLILFQRRFFSK
ncbi:MAG: lipoprotein signal peptidase [Bacteroidales bacterium]